VTLLKRTIRAVKLAATDTRIPKALRWLAGFGLLPIPGPVDEVVLLLVAIPLALLYRGPLADAWRQAAHTSSAGKRATKASVFAKGGPGNVM
jgi:hypothetical protein